MCAFTEEVVRSTRQLKTYEGVGKAVDASLAADGDFRKNKTKDQNVRGAWQQEQYHLVRVSCFSSRSAPPLVSAPGAASASSSFARRGVNEKLRIYTHE